MTHMNVAHAAQHFEKLGLTPEQALAAAKDPQVRVIVPQGPPTWSAEAMCARALELVQIGWCQFEQARDKSGNACEPSFLGAEYWTADGAINLAYGEAVAACLHAWEPKVAEYAIRCQRERQTLIEGLEARIEQWDIQTDRWYHSDGHGDVALPELCYWNDDDTRAQDEVARLFAEHLEALSDARRLVEAAIADNAASVQS